MTTAPVTLLGLLLGSAGCTTLQPVSNPARFIPETNPHVVYVTHAGGAVVAVAEPRVSGDSLLGTWQGLSRRVALPMVQIRRVEAIQRDKTRTTALIAGVTALTATLGYLVAQRAGGTSPHCDYSGVTHPLQGCDDPRPGH